MGRGESADYIAATLSRCAAAPSDDPQDFSKKLPLNQSWKNAMNTKKLESARSMNIGHPDAEVQLDNEVRGWVPRSLSAVGFLAPPSHLSHTKRVNCADWL